MIVKAMFNLFINQFNKLIKSSKESEERIKRFQEEFEIKKKIIDEEINRPITYSNKSIREDV